MKFFSIASAALVAFTGFVGLVAGQDSNTVVKDIKMLTKASSDAQTMVSSITVVNVVFEAPKVAQTLATIAQSVSSVTQDCFGPNGSPAVPLPDAAAVEIVEVLDTFVAVHQQLLSTIIGKHGIIMLFPFFGPPIAQALRGVEAVVDTFAFALIDLIPTQKDKAMEDHSSLMASLDAAVSDYQS